MKTMTKTFLIFLVVFLKIQAQDLPVVAIMNFDASGISETDAANITTRFGYELSRANQFVIIEREKMETILDEQEFSLSGCTSSECVVEIGQLLNVEYMIAGKISVTLGFFSLHVRLISVESGIVVTQIIEDLSDGTIQQFITSSVKNAAMKLAAEAGIKKSSGSSDQVVATVTRTGQVSFTLNTSPVNVFIDGSFSGENTSKSVSLSLPMGDHTIKFTAEGYQDYEKTISFIADQSIDYAVEMQTGTSGTVSKITTGIIVVRSDPEGATVYLDGRNVGATPVQVPKAGAGKHTIKVEKNLYHDYLEEITLQADGIVQVMAQMQAAFGSLEIISVPDGGVVSLNDQMKGRTPLKINELGSGEYEIAITKDLYHTHREKFIITDGSENNRNISLQPAFGQLSVNGKPTGAKVYLDSQERGKTPLTLNELPSGSYSLRIDFDLYASYESEIIIEDDKTNNQNYLLEPRFGTLNINGNPIGAKISVNGTIVGKLPLKLYKVTAGLAEIKIEKENYHPKTQFQQINVGDLVNLDIELERHTGTIVTLTDPPGAKVNLNDKSYGDSPQILKDMPIGAYNLTVTHSDYLPKMESFNLSLNERKEFNFKLMTYQGSIQQEIDNVKQIRTINLTATGILGITAGIIKMMSNSAYKKYEDAAATSKAVDLYDKANSLHKLSGIVGIAAGISATPVIKWQMDISKLGKKLK